MLREVLLNLDNVSLRQKLRLMAAKNAVCNKSPFQSLFPSLPPKEAPLLILGSVILGVYLNNATVVHSA
jgi:hypothetical protein